MKRIFLAIAIILSVQLYAERVDSNTALKVANTIVEDANLHNINTRGSYDNLYIFSSESSFVIISADDRVRPIIGYSDSNPFVIDEKMANVNYWLNNVDDKIQYVIDNNIEATEEIQREWKSLASGIRPEAKNRAIVEALLTTKWNQDAPFNELCPGGSMTGCGATAMAQVLKYWNWPKIGEGYKSYYEVSYGKLTADFGTTIYDWDNMLDKPTKNSSPEERKAVATLMYHCGVSVNMRYTPEASGAYPNDIAPAFTTYFRYNPETIEDRTFHYMISDNEWISMLKDELDKRRPVIYNGWDIDGMGHSFVCDGYDEQDNFHFNWGWGGHNDGYFAIGALSPGTGGIGSGSGQYNENNYVTIGIEPDYDNVDPLSLVTHSDGFEPVINLKWTSIYENASYNIYRTFNGNTTQIATNVTEKSYDDTDIEFNKEYCYVVKSVVDNVENDESNESCFNVAPNPCIPPSNIKATVVENDPDFNKRFKITITWDPISIGKGYIVYINGSEYEEVSETTCIIGSTKEATIEVNVQSACNNGYDSPLSETLTVEVKHVGIDEYDNGNFKIYPNPVNDMLFIEGDAKIEEVNIFNVTGINVYSNTDVNNSIDVSNLNKGVYIVNIKTADGNIVKRFVKE